jgi:hypothetical protein
MNRLQFNVIVVDHVAGICNDPVLAVDGLKQGRTITADRSIRFENFEAAAAIHGNPLRTLKVEHDSFSGRRCRNRGRGAMPRAGHIRRVSRCTERQNRQNARRRHRTEQAVFHFGVLPSLPIRAALSRNARKQGTRDQNFSSELSESHSERSKLNHVTDTAYAK